MLVLYKPPGEALSFAQLIGGQQSLQSRISGMYHHSSRNCYWAFTVPVHSWTSENTKPPTSTSKFQLASTSRGPATVSQNFRGPAPESRQRDFPRVRGGGPVPMSLSLRRWQARLFCLDDAVVFVDPAPADVVLRGPPLWLMRPRVVPTHHASRWCSHMSSASAKSGTKRSLSTLRFTGRRRHPWWWTQESSAEAGRTGGGPGRVDQFMTQC